MKKNNHQPKFKSGATSIYAVVIATLLFSVIVVSFIRIIVSEANRTASDELAQMAYDAALAGVEDAKAAVKKYLSNPSDQATYDAYIAGDATHDSCDAVQRILYGSEGGVKLSERGNGTAEGSTSQSYTCVLFSSVSSDYRSSLSRDNPIRMIPLRVSKTGDPSAVKYLQISWHSKDNGTSLTFANSGGKFKSVSNNGAKAPATLSATVIQTGNGDFTVEDFDKTTDSGTNRAMAFLVPSSNGQSIATVTASTLVNSNRHAGSSGFTLSATDTLPTNSPTSVQCDSSFNVDDYACHAYLELPNPYNSTNRNRDTFYLVLALPYSDPDTEFSIKMLDNDKNPIQFDGVQYIIDSTGRANDMFSRVEARVEFADTSYPFPQYALQSSGDINKDFYVTADCTQTTSGGATDPWTVQACADSAPSKEK